MENKCYCSNCSKEISEHAEICPACGVRVGKVVKYCFHCGNEVNENQEICLNCGVNPRNIKKSGQASGNNQSVSMGSKETVNTSLVAIVGFLLPGLPSILWLGQKTKGISLLVGYVVLWMLIPALTFILCPFAAVDAYRLAKKVNSGEVLEEWSFL